MDYEDRVSIATPEGVTLDLTLAGLGSRLTAAVLDFLVQAAIIIALTIVAALLGGGGSAVVAAIATVAGFLVIFGYDVLFETFSSGRTPGKRWSGLRVVRVDGRPVTFIVSAVRNLIRLVDFLPILYAVGAVTMLITKKNQRLGDLAAGTLVVRDRRGSDTVATLTAAAAGIASPEAEATWDVSAVSSEELAALRQFLQRRTQLRPDARRRLALQLAAQLRPKVVAPLADEDAESFLVALAAIKTARS